MPRYVNHRFGIDVYRKGEYQGTNYVDLQIEEDDEEIMRVSCFKGERLPAQSVLADTYALVYTKAYEQEEQCFQKQGYPYLGVGNFEEYSLKIFV